MQFQKGHIPWNKNKKRSKEIKEKISKRLKILWQNPKYRKHMCEAHKGKISSMKGKNHSKETKEKISKKLKGRHLSEITKRRIGEAERKEKHWNWKGGITPKNIEIRNSLKSKKWRNKIFVRDDWTCRKCKRRGIELHAHHILGFSESHRLKFNINNGISLCKECHWRFHKLYGRKNNKTKELKDFLKS